MGRNTRGGKGQKHQKSKKHQKKRLNSAQQVEQCVASSIVPCVMPSHASQLIHLPEEIFAKIIAYLPLESMVVLTQVSRWCYFCVHNTMGCKSNTHHFRVEKTVPNLGNIHRSIQNFMRCALPAWPCVLFCINVEEESAAFVEHSLSKYTTPNLWVLTSYRIPYCPKIVECPALHGISLNSDEHIDWKKASPTIRVLELYYSTRTCLYDYPPNKLTTVDLFNFDGNEIPSNLASVPIFYAKSCKRLSNVKNLNGVKRLSLRGCTSVIDVSALNRVHTLDLAGCTSVVDVSMLGDVHTLDLNGCTSVTDVSKLGNVHSLNLTWCTRVLDVSGLGNVHDLNLRGCSQAFDVSALGRVHTLNLSSCEQVTGVSELGGVHTLSLAECRTNLTDVSALGNVHSLDLSGCTSVADVSALGNVHTLNLAWCTSVVDVSELGGVHTLNLSHCNQIVDVSALGNVHSLNLTWCVKVKNVNALGNVYSLTLIGCHQVSDVHALGRVHSLDVRLTAVKDVSALRNTSLLCIACTGVTDVSMVGFGIKIIISKCMATHRTSHPGVIYQDGQNICIIAEDDVSADRYLHCSVCYPFDEYDLDFYPYDDEY